MKHTFKAMDNVAHVILALGIAGVLTVVYTAGGSTKDDCHVPSAGQPMMKVTEVPKRKECVCRELASVLKENVYDGLISIEQAERMVQHCWSQEF